MTQTTAALQRPANATSNPFTEISRTYKRPLDAVEGESFRWESVQRPWKRDHRGTRSSLLCFLQIPEAIAPRTRAGQAPPWLSLQAMCWHRCTLCHQPGLFEYSDTCSIS